MTNGEVLFLMFVCLFAGFFLALILLGPQMKTLNALCDQKYGTGSWIPAYEDGYWVCNSKDRIDIQCRIDGIGIERCNGK
jgi:hypothetical protein